MALKWVEGFESYSNLIGWVQYRYASFIAPSATFVSGRALGNALNFNGTALVTPTFSNLNEYIVGFAFRNVNLGISNVSMPVVEFRDGTSQQITITFNPSTRVFAIWRGANATLLATGTFVLTTGAWYYIEARVVIDSAVGSAQVKVNTIADATYSGNTQATANAYANTIAWKGPAAIGLGGAYQLDDMYINDATGTVNNSFLGDMKVEGVNVIDSGNYAQWGVNVPGTPNYQAVQVLNDGLYISSNTAGQKDSYECSSLNFISSNIAGVSAVYWGRNTDSTVHAIQSLIRISVTDYVGSVIPIIDTAFKAYQEIWETDPSTLAAWTIPGVAAAEYGVNLNS